MCNAAGWDFIPMIVETYGRWDSRAHTHFERLAPLYARRQGCTVAQAIASLYRGLGITRIRALAQTLLHKDPGPAGMSQ